MTEAEFDAEFIALLGYGLYSINGGKLEADAKFAIADPLNDADGYYLEAATVETLFAEFDEFLKAGAVV